MVIKYSLELSSLDTPSLNISVSLEVCNFQIQRHFGWRYAIGRALRMFPQLHVYLIMKLNFSSVALFLETIIEKVTFNF